MLALATTVRGAFGEAPTPVDVVIHDAPPPRRYVAIEWNPLPLFTIGKLSANVVVVPIEHHSLVLNPFYSSTSTAPIFVYDSSGNPTQLGKQTFRGFGAELGYRYYSGLGGPRGVYIGPSLILASFTATAADNSKTHFFDYGLAADVGYEALVADQVALSLGAGLQYLVTSKSIPDQQFPAKLYANGGLRPRLLLSVGWAF